MKSYITKVLFILTIICLICISIEYKVDADENSDNLDGYVEPVFGTGEIDYADEEAFWNWDDYEYNDMYYNATDISFSYNPNQLNYNKTVHGTIHQTLFYFLGTEWSADQDYFRLDIFGDAHLTVNLSVPSNMNYNVDLWKHIDSDLGGYTSSSIEKIGQSLTGGIGQSEQIYINENNPSISSLSAGTYYIRVYAHNENYTSNNDYTLSYNLEYIEYDDASIGELKYHKGAKAAIWKSDFDPFGYNSFNLTGEVTMTDHPSPIHNKLENLSPTNGIINSTIYIWDQNLRNQLCNYFQEIIDDLDETIDRNEEITVEVEKVEDAAKNVGYFLKIFGTASGNQYILVAGSVLGGMGSIGGAFLKAMFPEPWDTKYGDAVDYITMLKNILYTENSNLGTEVIVINSRYKYEDNKISFYPQISTNEVFKIYSDTISIYNIEGLMNGKIYGIRNSNDLETFINTGATFELEDVNTCDPINFNLNDDEELYLNPQQYFWYKFTAPSIGEYKFYSEGEADVYGELFSSIVVGKTSDGVIKYSNDYNGDINFSITHQLSQNQTIYLRVRGSGWNSTGNSTIYVVEVPHIHNYTFRYVKNNSINHIAYCSCGVYITQMHSWTQDAFGSRCSKCNYSTDGPVIVNSIKPVRQPDDLYIIMSTSNVCVLNNLETKKELKK